jgi:hypothetical protein
LARKKESKRKREKRGRERERVYVREITIVLTTTDNLMLFATTFSIIKRGEEREGVCVRKDANLLLQNSY